MVITKFNLFEGADFDDCDYVVCLPSGEVIYTEGADLKELELKRIIFKNSYKDIYFLCADYYANNVRKYIEAVRKPVISSTRSNIMKFLEDCGLLPDQYKILEDLSIDVMGPVNMSYKNLKKIPFKFNRCTSNFNCSHNNLITLENSPASVHGVFNCSYNDLENLENGPKMVSKAYNCSNNYLKTLKGAPIRLTFFDCSNNLLTDLKYAPLVSDIFLKNNNRFK